MASIAEMNRRASREYPAVEVEWHRLHVFCQRGEWCVWLNTEVSDFDGLCLAVEATRDLAVTRAVRVLEACVEELQRPFEGTRETKDDGK